MKRDVLLAIAITATTFGITGCENDHRQSNAPSSRAGSDSASADKERSSMPYEVTKSDDEWREILTPQQYHVTREAGTERAFTGKYWDHKDDGTYTCVCCGAKLFNSQSKFDSGCGWPSFDKPMSEAAIREREDDSFGMHRTEVICPKCGAHLGHVFDDGPTSTGLRYCINSASLDFKPGEEK